MKADYVHKDTLTATDYVDLNKNNELLISYNQALLKENQELKKKYENAVADYETTMFEKEQLNSLVNSCQEEIRQLKKQLHEASLTIQEMIEQDIECPSNCEKLRQLKKQVEEKETIACNWKDSCLENAGKIEILETQQKEFIKYLEDEIKRLKENDIYQSLQKMALATHEHTLQKYKSIIGVSDDKKRI